MCGIAGLFAVDRGRAVDAAVAARMAARLRHRGPDGESVHAGPGFALAHTRLSVIDLAGGSQPMGLPDGSLWVVFNGEIYNHEELRAELVAGGAVFRTRSDTEVLLHGWRAWGEGLAARLFGMFAFAVVDVAAGTLYCARDRFGKKPFHWLPPAHWRMWRDGRWTERRYWQLEFGADERTDAEHAERTLALLDEAVRCRLMAEVPLAPFLSGGVDSYAIVDAMTRLQGRPVTACTIGFPDPAFDERDGARASAAACGARLIEEVLEPQALLQLDWLAETFDEPFSDSSAVPTYHVCKLARRHVTVALAGDGGDEAFGGYRRYLFDLGEHRARRFVPRWLAGALGAAYPKADWLPRWLRAKRTLQDLGSPPAVAYARSVSAHLPEEVFAVLRRDRLAEVGDPHAPVVAAYESAPASHPLHKAVAADLATWLPGDILVKADRASMAVALEVRAPFLDHRLFQHAMRIPPDRHLRGGRTKAFLRGALASRLAPAALQRKKQGFSVPLRAWCKGAVGDAVAAALHDAPLREWIDPAAVEKLLARHRAGVGDHGEMLWAVLVLARFLRRWAA
jgi:asparagine synthase (glutamine-hydrolysing)